MLTSKCVNAWLDIIRSQRPSCCPTSLPLHMVAAALNQNSLTLRVPTMTIVLPPLQHINAVAYGKSRPPHPPCPSLNSKSPPQINFDAHC